jgi:hypothetical protein
MKLERTTEEERMKLEQQPAKNAKPRKQKRQREQHNAALDPDLERMPMGVLSQRRTVQTELKLQPNGEPKPIWKVSVSRQTPILTDAADIPLPVLPGSHDYDIIEKRVGLPGPFSQDLYIAICYLFNEARRPQSRTVTATFHEFAQIMNRENGGGFYQDMRNAIAELAAVTFTTQKPINGKYLHRKETDYFHLFERIKIRDGADGESTTTVEATISKAIGECYERGQYRLLDVRTYFLGLRNAAARRLYRILDLEKNSWKNQHSTLSIPIKELAERIPISQKAPSDIERVLENAHQELIENGFLLSAKYEKEDVAGKKRPIISVRYRFGTVESEKAEIPANYREITTPRLPRPATTTNGNGPSIRQKVDQIANLLQSQEHTGASIMAIQALSDEQLDGIIGSVRESIRNGKALDAARAEFFSLAKERAAANGIDLYKNGPAL